MQKDIHFNLTYALSRKVGICTKDAKIIAWADQFTDEMTKAGLYGIQTQSAILGNWGDDQIQLSVLVPFHFVPGEKGWIVTPNNERARALVAEAKNVFELGIALHALQDTFSHQGFSGWEEKANACFPWWYLKSGLPNIGHAEMGVTPDVVNNIWTDPRTGEVIDNKKRAHACAAATFGVLAGYGRKKVNWPRIDIRLEDMFRMKYDDRKKALMKMAGDSTRFKKLNFHKKYRQDFIKAARKQLSMVMKTI
jgi:hypothetical protein